MTLKSALDDRYARWLNELYDWGYRLEDPLPPAGANQIAIRARREETLGDPGVVVDIRETWLSGSDPDGLSLTQHGCYLDHAAWHAQFASPGPAWAERLDVDRSKDTALKIHRHPLGTPNNVRLTEPRLLAPAAWLDRVEGLVLGL
jgi:hypothetical protein